MLANGENKKHAAADGVRINLKVKSQIVDVPSYVLGVFGCFSPVWMLFDSWQYSELSLLRQNRSTTRGRIPPRFIDAIWCEAVMSLNGCDEDETIRILARRPTMVAAMADMSVARLFEAPTHCRKRVYTYNLLTAFSISFYVIRMMVISFVMGCDGSNGFNKDVYVSDFIRPILLLRLLAYLSLYEKVPSELKRVIMHGRTDKKLTQAQLAQGRTDKKLTQAQLAQMINEKPQIIQETISTTEEVFLAAEFPTVHVVEPSPIIITPSSITAPMPDLLDLGLSGEDNSVIVPIDQPASPIGPQAMKCLVTMSEVLGDHIWLASMATLSSY
ncbi:hypothetical protein Tco_0453113 [Tanacetum coccineum]